MIAKELNKRNTGEGSFNVLHIIQSNNDFEHLGNSTVIRNVNTSQRIINQIVLNLG